MNVILENMEKEIISLMLREYPDWSILINKASITKREFTGVGFYTYYNNDDILCDKNMVISGGGGKLNNSIEIGFIFLLEKTESMFLNVIRMGSCSRIRLNASKSSYKRKT